MIDQKWPFGQNVITKTIIDRNQSTKILAGGERKAVWLDCDLKSLARRDWSGDLTYWFDL